jgi:plastocyanin
MNHYQITGVIILIGLIIVATLTFWPSVTTPSTSVVAAPTTQATTPTPAKAGAAALPAGAGARTYENGVYVTTVYYTKTGFVPAQLTLTKGEEVRFVNKTAGVMHVIGDEKLSSKYYGLVNQQNSLAKDDTYQIKLPELGIFVYSNLNTNPLKSGQIIVK